MAKLRDQSRQSFRRNLDCFSGMRTGVPSIELGHQVFLKLRNLRVSQLLLFPMVAILGLLGGCAGQSIRESDPSVVSEGPKSLSADLLKRFEVEEIEVARPEGAPQKKPKPKAKKKSSLKYPVRNPNGDLVWVGEKASFDISFIGMVAGVFTLEVLPPKLIGGRRVLQIQATARSSKLFSMFYELNDVFDSFMDLEGFYSHRFQTLMDETKQYRKSLELNDSEKGTHTFWNLRKSKDFGNEEKNETIPMKPFSQDLFSNLYYIRTLEPLTDGAKFRYPYVSEGKNMEMEMIVLRREEIGTPLGRRQTVVLKPVLWHEGNSKPGEFAIWVLDDPRRMIVRMEAKVKIGTIVASATEMSVGVPPAPSPAPASVPK